MDNMNSPPEKKIHSKSEENFIIRESDIVYLEREVVTDYKKSLSFKINEKFPSQQHKSFPPSIDDAIPTFEIFPDFSKNPSQKHYLVSPDAALQASPAPESEFYLPVSIPQAAQTLKKLKFEKYETAVNSGMTPAPQQSHAMAGPQRSGNTIEKETSFLSVSTKKTYHELDKATIELVRSEPLLSEDEIFIHLKERFADLTKQEVRNALIRNGLDTDYKRFRAYMAC